MRRYARHSMSEAIFGLVGVIVGVALSACFSELAEYRRNRAEARAASRMLERELKAALRGMQHWIVAKSAVHPTRDEVLRFPAWKLYHAVAARSLPATDWDAVSDCYLEFHEIRTDDAFAADLNDAAIGRLVAIEKAAFAAAGRLHVHTHRPLGKLSGGA
jgi:hypothetical protein